MRPASVMVWFQSWSVTEKSWGCWNDDKKRIRIAYCHFFRDLLKAPPCPSLLSLSQTKILFSFDSKIITSYQDNNPRSLLTLCLLLLVKSSMLFFRTWQQCPLRDGWAKAGVSVFFCFIFMCLNGIFILTKLHGGSSCLCVSQGMFEPYLKSFYIRSTDPTQIKVLKVAFCSLFLKMVRSF